MRARTATRSTATRAAPREAELFDVNPDRCFRIRPKEYRRIIAMRLIPVFSIVSLLSISGTLFAQEWVEFASREDRFTCNFPSQPTITQTTFKSERGAVLPARNYSVTQGQSRYSVTVVDYNPIEQILTEKAKSCPV